jgi:UDP-glucose 4-epimerase
MYEGFDKNGDGYGDHNSEDGMSLEGDVRGHNLTCAYSLTKLVGEMMISNFAKLKNFRHISLRYFNPIGTTVKEDKGGSVASYLMNSHRVGDAFTINGTDYDTHDGTCIRDYIDMRDLVDAHLYALDHILAMDQAEVINEVFNVGTGIPTTVRELAETFKSVSGVDFQILEGPRRAGDTAGTCAGVSKIYDRLGWTSKYTIEDTFKYIGRGQLHTIGRHRRYPYQPYSRKGRNLQHVGLLP